MGFKPRSNRSVLLDPNSEQLLITCLRILTRSVSLYLPEDGEDPVKDSRGVPLFQTIQNRQNTLGVVPVVVTLINTGVNSLVKEALKLALALLSGPNLQIQVMRPLASISPSLDLRT